MLVILCVSLIQIISIKNLPWGNKINFIMPVTLLLTLAISIWHMWKATTKSNVILFFILKQLKNSHLKEKKKTKPISSSSTSYHSLLRVHFFKKIHKSENRLCVSLLNRSIQDHMDHRGSKEPKNPCPEWILQFQTLKVD